MRADGPGLLLQDRLCLSLMHLLSVCVCVCVCVCDATPVASRDEPCVLKCLPLERMPYKKTKRIKGDFCDFQDVNDNFRLRYSPFLHGLF